MIEKMMLTINIMGIIILATKDTHIFKIMNKKITNLDVYFAYLICQARDFLINRWLYIRFKFLLIYGNLSFEFVIDAFHCKSNGLTCTFNAYV